MNTWITGKNSMKHRYLKKHYSCLNVEVITDAGYIHANRTCKDFKIKNFG